MSPLPSVDRVLRHARLAEVIASAGRSVVVASARSVLADYRQARETLPPPSEDAIVSAVMDEVARRSRSTLRAMYNLTGTVLHTNLGRAPLSEHAVELASMAMRSACNLEFDLETGGRGDRDSLVENLLTALTGAEAATVVNNNAAAVLLTLAALAEDREVVVSRGELVEIGGAFRVPDVMRAAHCRLVEVGTTNRTHPRDYEAAIGAQTAALMKVHASNYQITGFTAAVDEAQVAAIAHARGLPLVVDLGAGSLIDLTAYGLPREPVVRDMIGAGADLVTFSGDKLLGGPQAGLVVGRRDLIERIRRHPMKRALRLSKMTLAALEATLRLYRFPERLASELPTLRLLTRSLPEIEAMARALAPPMAAALGANWSVVVIDASSQVGSGSLPGEVLPSKAIAITPLSGSGRDLAELAARMRALPMPVIGRIAEGAMVLDMRCLEQVDAFLGQWEALNA